MSEEEIKREEETPAETPTETTASEPEITEENFVPDFNLEYEQNKWKRKRILLLCLLGAAVLLGLFIIFGRRNCLYNRMMRNLEFDYRNGEEIDNTQTALTGWAERAADAVAGKNLTLQANMYCFNSSGALSLSASKYSYERTADGTADLHIQTGGANSIRTEKSSYHTDANGKAEQVSGSLSQNADLYAAELLYDFCFAVEDTDRIKIERRNAYETFVGERRYTCEVWVMSATVNKTLKYFTLYRYYSGSELNALRMLDTTSDLMFVYDITEYTAA